MNELRGRYDTLSRRERKVISLIGTRMLDKQVTGVLGISEITSRCTAGT